MMVNNYEISISSEAASQVKIRLEKRKTPNSYLRIGLKGSGCNGFQYIIQYEDNSPKEKDYVFESNGIKIIIDAKSIIYLNGTIIDYESTLMKSGFKFINPNEKSTCSCGASFSVL